MEIVLAIISTVLTGTTVLQLLTIRSQREKIKALASQEAAKADGLNLDNIRSLLALQGEQLLASETRNGELAKTNDTLGKEIRENKYRLDEFERKIKGLERVVKSEISRRSYAEHRICLDLDCTKREPELGEFQIKE